MGSHLGRLLGIPWMLLGVASMANCIKEFSDFFWEVSLDEKMSKFINRRTFERIDSDGNGGLSRAEFRSYVLVHHGYVSHDVLETIDAHYNGLDTDKRNFVSYETFNRAH